MENLSFFLYTDDMLGALYQLVQRMESRAHQSILNSHMKNTYLFNSLAEESINSSQLEGASTTWRVAKEMLRQKRKTPQ